MRYIEMSLDEAMKKCKKSARILVAEQDLNEKNVDIVFFQRKGKDCESVFDDIKTVASMSDDLVEQLNLFTEKQDIMNIRPYGTKRIVILRE